MLQPQADDQRLIQPVQLPRETIFDHRYVLGKLISLDLDFVGQSTFSRSKISVKAINTVSKTSPGFMTLYHYSMGLLSGSEALAQLKTLGEQGSLSLQDIDQDGRNYVEVGHDPSYQSKRDFKWLTIC